MHLLLSKAPEFDENNFRAYQNKKRKLLFLRKDIVAVIPKDEALAAYDIAQKRAQKDGSMSLEQWQAEHVEKVESMLAKLGFAE